MRDYKLRKSIWGQIDAKALDDDFRTVSVHFPKGSDDDQERTITYGGNDGVILYLVKRIEKLEDRVKQLERYKNPYVLSNTLSVDGNAKWVVPIKPKRPVGHPRKIKN